MGQVKCSVCGQLKNLPEYYTNNNAKSGRYSFCKNCYKEKEQYRKKYGTVKMKRKLDPTIEKYCSNCKRVKPLSEFVGTRYEGKRTSKCKKCLGDAHIRRNTKVRAHTSNMNSVFTRYGLTEAQLQDLLLEQQGCCKLCGADFGTELTTHDGRQYHIDHDHETGKVRGLLCAGCNRTLGMIEKLNLDKVKAYLI